MPKFPKLSLPDWPVRTWIGIGILGFFLIAGFSWWGWWNSWSLPDWSVAKYEYLNGPTVLEEVREIGELVGAEYYGEVIHSLLEQQEAEDWMLLGDLYEEVKLMYGRHYRTSKEMPVRRTESQVRQDAFARFALKIGTLSRPTWYRNIFVRLGPTEANLLEEIRNSSWNSFSQKYREGLLRQRRILRQEVQYDPVLIYLGRGDVLIGYDLKSLSVDQMIRQGDTLILRDLDPKIISAAINPWYISPDEDSTGKGVPGFESLREEGTVTQEMVSKVKAGCKRELIREAFRNGAAELAEQSVEQTLKSFFNLLAKPGETISILDIQPSLRYENIRRWTMDGRISSQELQEIKSAAATDSLSSEWLPVLNTFVEGWGNDLDWTVLQ